MTSIQGTAPAGATTSARLTGSAGPVDASSIGITSGMSAVAPPLLLDVGALQSGGGLSGLRLPQSSEDAAALLAEVEMKLNGTMSKTRANGIVGAFATRLGALDTIAAAQAAQAAARIALATGQADLAAGQASLATDQAQLAATQADLEATQGDLAATTSDLGAKTSDLAARQADLAARQTDLASAQSQADADRQALVPLEAQSARLAQTIGSLSSQAAITQAQLIVAKAEGDASRIAALGDQLSGIRADLAAAQSGKADVDGRIGTLETDLSQQAGRIALDQSWIAADQEGIAGDQAAIAADRESIAADQDRIQADTADMTAEQERIQGDQDAIAEAEDAISAAQKAIGAAQAQVQISSLVVSSQLALTSGTDDRSRHNATVSAQLDLGFERLQKSAEEFRRKDQQRTEAAQGHTPERGSAAPTDRAEALAEGLTAALEAARATMLQLAQQATAAGASAAPNRLRLSL